MKIGYDLDSRLRGNDGVIKEWRCDYGMAVWLAMTKEGVMACGLKICRHCFY